MVEDVRAIETPDYPTTTFVWVTGFLLTRRRRRVLTHKSIRDFPRSVNNLPRELDRLVWSDKDAITAKAAQETPMTVRIRLTTRVFDMLSPCLSSFLPKTRVDFVGEAINFRTRRIPTPNLVPLLPKLDDVTWSVRNKISATAGRDRLTGCGHQNALESRRSLRRRRWRRLCSKSFLS